LEGGVMWQKAVKKTLFTLNLDPEKYKPITDLTYPFMKGYAKKIGAEFYEIKERKFLEAKSPTYEKVQVYQLAQEMENDWNIFMDADTLVHPDTMDLTNFLSKDTVLHHGSDLAVFRWKYDRFLLRDGRNIGSCTWLNIASDWCIDLFKPLDDMTLEEAENSIFPLTVELLRGVEGWRLIEDFVFSRNIAKYGLKFISIIDLLKNKFDFPSHELFWHTYMTPIEIKVIELKSKMSAWRLL
jgi:hypothetical protein